MLDAKRLLEQFLGGRTGDGRKPAKGFDLSQIGDLARTLGSGKAGGLPGGGIPGGGLGGNLGGGALAGSLAALVLGSKKGRKLGGSALKVGGMALVGALAYKAYRDWQSGGRPAFGRPTPADGGASLIPPPPEGTPFNPSTEAGQQALSLALLRAMIAAAKADGHIDAQEQANIFTQMDRLDLDAEGKAFVMDELRSPLDVDAVAKGASTPEEAAEIYTASLLAIDVDNAAERAYLALLAARLKLDEGLVEHLHATVESAAGKA